MTDYNSNATVLVVNATVGPVFYGASFSILGFVWPSVTGWVIN